MIKLIAFLKRDPGMTREQFERRWLDEHIKISSKLPGLRGYRINIATERQPEGIGTEPLYDGTAEMWWDSIDDMENSFATELGQQAGADGDVFTSLRKHLYTEEHMIVPGPEKPAARKTGKRSTKKGVSKKQAAGRTSKRAAKRAR